MTEIYYDFENGSGKTEGNDCSYEASKIRRRSTHGMRTGFSLVFSYFCIKTV